jgi:hypothetical protein
MAPLYSSLLLGVSTTTMQQIYVLQASADYCHDSFLLAAPLNHPQVFMFDAVVSGLLTLSPGRSAFSVHRPAMRRWRTQSTSPSRCHATTCESTTLHPDPALRLARVRGGASAPWLLPKLDPNVVKAAFGAVGELLVCSLLGAVATRKGVLDRVVVVRA